MEFAFVPPTALPGPTAGRACFASEFAPGPSCGVCRAGSRSSMQMSLEGLSRRALLRGALAAAALATLGGAGEARAKSGDAPIISIFGVGGASSPFDAGFERSGTVVYQSFNDEERKYFSRVVGEAQDRLDGATESIKGKVWEDIRSRIRLEMNQMRSMANKINSNIADDKDRKSADKSYEQFKQAIQDLDYAASIKNQDKAYKAFTAAQTSLASWRNTVGF